MNKRKIAFITVPILAGCALIGATLAAWAVTDNANPLGIKITPKENEHGDYSTMVLEWGETNTFTDLSGFQLGEANAKASKIQVKSTVTTTTGISGGNLVLKVEDRTSRGQGDTKEKLISHLHVEAYSSRTGEGTTESPYVYDGKIVEVNPSSTDHTANANFVTPVEGTATDVFFKIFIDNEGDAALKFEEMKNDIVYFTVDWNRPTSITDGDLVTSNTIYYKDTTNTDLAVWAWNSTSGDTNATEWPGVRMVKMSGVTGGYWSYELPAQYDRLIFSWGDHGDSAKTDTINTPANLALTPYWNGSAWVEAPEFVEVDYHCIGTHNSWTKDATNKLTKVDANNYTIDITTTVANSELKIMANDGMTYWGETTVGTSEGTEVFKIGAVGNYTITFHPNGVLVGETGHEVLTFIQCAQKGA